MKNSVAALIQKFAFIILFVGIILGLLTSIGTVSFFENYKFLVFIISFILSSFGSAVVFFILYGLAELIEIQHNSLEVLEKQAKQINKIVETFEMKSTENKTPDTNKVSSPKKVEIPKVLGSADFEYVSEDKIKCLSCNIVQNANRTVCYECGRKFTK